jgi:hypothetical protein
VVEGARLESVYTSKAYRGFESRPVRANQPVTCVTRQNPSFSAVAAERPPAYGPIMMVGTSASRPARAVRSLMLALGIVATPSVGTEAMQRPHCAQHDLAARHLQHATASSRLGHGHDEQAWTQRHDHGCPHCPASECARVSPCTGSSSNAVAPSCAVAKGLDSHGVPVDLTRLHLQSASSPPGTPPPQVIA